jgi:hypothetical protein
MDTPQPQHHNAHLAIGVFCAALLATVGFHFLFFQRQYGVAFALFILLLVAGVHTLTVLSGKRGNLWAYIFLLPVLCGIVAEVLYASMLVRDLGFLITLGSLTMFTYWFTSAQVRLRDVSNLLPWNLFAESFFPFTRVSEVFKLLVHGKSQTKRVLIGAVIAVPFLIIFGLLFVSADAYLQKVVGDMFMFTNVAQLITRVIWDTFALLFFLAAGWMLITRLIEGRRPHQVEWTASFDSVITTSFLTLLNLLFLVFLGFQLLYFFGGQAVIMAKGISYASYAREGFFQLMTVAIIVFLILAGVYLFTGMKHWAVRGLSILLIVQTAVVNASAIRRLLLYIDAYDLTLSRVWAMIVIILVSVLLMIVLFGIAFNATFTSIYKIGFFTVLFAVSAILCWNTERSIASYNVSRYLNRETDQIDVKYLINLSSDAIPELVRYYNTPWPVGWVIDDVSPPLRWTDNVSGYTRTDLKTILTDKRAGLQQHRDADWRDLVLSDYIALSVLPME